MSQPHVVGGGLVNPRHHKHSPLTQLAGHSGTITPATLDSVAGRTGVVVLTAADFGAGTFPGDVVFTSGSTGSTQTAGNSTTRIATTAFATTADNLKADLSGPTLTGTPSFPTGTTGVTQTAADNTTKLATTAYVDTADALKANLASPTLTSTPSFPTGTTATTQSAANSTTLLATTAFATTADNLKANLASPTFTGTVTVPNGASATNIGAFGQLPTAAGTVGSWAKIVARTTDSATMSSGTLANDTQLLFAVGANDRWIIQGFLTFTAADGAGSATTADIKSGWSVPASGTMQHGLLAIGNVSGGYVSTGVGASPNSARTAAQATQNAGSSVATYGVSIGGYYTGGGTAGNVNLQWAQATTNASTLQINTNSILILWRIA